MVADRTNPVTADLWTCQLNLAKRARVLQARSRSSPASPRAYACVRTALVHKFDLLCLSV